MNVALRPAWTMERFLEWEERQELRYEFDGRGPVAMTGGTEAHAEIQINLTTAIKTRLDRPPCRVIGSKLKFLLPDRVRYPDAMIVCSPRGLGRTGVSDPVIVFEILSASSVGTDLINKNSEYRLAPSLQRYVVVQQSEPAAMAFVRRGEDWIVEVALGMNAMLPLPEVGIEVPLAEVFADIVFPEPEPARS